MKAKVALYKNTTYSFGSPLVSMLDEDGEGFDDRNKEYARVSEIVEVEFPPLSDEALIRGQLDSLDKTEQQIRLQFQQKLNDIQNRRAELQALTYVEQETTAEVAAETAAREFKPTRIVVPNECPKCGPSCQCDIAWNE